MSAKDKKPEVGDVWEFGGFLYHVRSLDEDGVTSICDEGDFVIGYYDSIEDFVNRSTYIGKSKASVNQLFEVENYGLGSLHCNSCGKDVFQEPQDYFMLKDEIWQEVCKSDYVSIYSVLCKDCTEKALGRKLVREDYQDNIPCNEFLFEEE